MDSHADRLPSWLKLFPDNPPKKVSRCKSCKVEIGLDICSQKAHAGFWASMTNPLNPKRHRCDEAKMKRHQPISDFEYVIYKTTGLLLPDDERM